jgi:hypothetical protein
MEDLPLQEIAGCFSSNEDDLVKVMTMYDRALEAREQSRQQSHEHSRNHKAAHKLWAEVTKLLRVCHACKSFVCETLKCFIKAVGPPTAPAGATQPLLPPRAAGGATAAAAAAERTSQSAAQRRRQAAAAAAAAAALPHHTPAAQASPMWTCHPLPSTTSWPLF